MYQMFTKKMQKIATADNYYRDLADDLNRYGNDSAEYLKGLRENWDGKSDLAFTSDIAREFAIMWYSTDFSENCVLSEKAEFDKLYHTAMVNFFYDVPADKQRVTKDAKKCLINSYNELAELVAKKVLNRECKTDNVDALSYEDTLSYLTKKELLKKAV